MLAFDRAGSGEPLLLLHGTTSSRQIWAPLLPTLVKHADVIAVDLPGHGDSPPSSYSPPDWAKEVADLLDRLGLARIAAMGHSAGGWTALELAKAGRATAVVALTPAGLWRRHSPLATDIALNANWRLGRLSRGLALRVLRSPRVRSLSFRGISAKPENIPADVAISNARAAIEMDSFPRHFRETRLLRFTAGQGIDVPVKVVWGGRDRIALAGKSRHVDELPPQTQVETWPDCGHMVMWDAPERVVAAARCLVQTALDSPEDRHAL
jgi:pimeloyl-ACP methyl ester carboxylesterase